jgi:nucleoside-diphosphate kinase
MSTLQRTLVLVKPDGLQRGLLGKVITRFERKTLSLLAIKVAQTSPDTAQRHYDEHRDKPFFCGLTQFLTSGPVCAMYWEGEDVVHVARTLIGESAPSQKIPGTIRGDFTNDLRRNVIHASSSIESAKRELNIWFEPSDFIHSQHINLSPFLHC